MSTPGAISRISCEKARELLTAGPCQVVDIRDAQSYLLGHPSGAEPLDNSTLANFLQRANREQTTLVFCYHGNSSQQAAHFLHQEGFTQVHSVDGGVELWRQQYPDLMEAMA